MLWEIEKILSNSWSSIFTIPWGVQFWLETPHSPSPPWLSQSLQGGFPRFFSSKSMEIVGSLIMKRTFLQKLPLLGVMLPGSNDMKVASPLVWASRNLCRRSILSKSSRSWFGQLGSRSRSGFLTKRIASAIREFCLPKWDDFNKRNCKK